MIIMEMMEVGWVAFRSIGRRVRLLGSCDDVYGMNGWVTIYMYRGGICLF